MPEIQPPVIAIGFFATGVVAFATAVLLLFAPRNREVRWFSAFNAGLTGWLLGQAMAAAGSPGSPSFWLWLETASGDLLPGLFLAFGLAQNPRQPPWIPSLALLPGLAVLAAIVASAGVPGTGPMGAVERGWQVAGWSAGAVTLVRHRRSVEAAERLRRGRSLLLGLLSAAPLIVVIGLLLGDARFFLYALPLIVVVIQLALFVGVARLRFYDIEVRAERSGALAAEAAEMVRLATVGELAATFAHEVRNPLTGVRSLAQRIADDDVAEPKRRHYATVILGELARVERIVENLLSVARRRPPQRWNGEATALDSLFDDVRLLVSSRAQRAGVTVEVEGAGLSAAAPRESLAQALLNLVLNGIAHSPAGGRVQLEAERDGGGVTIAVSDQGPGVPAAERDRVFEPFHSGRPDGVGLGLSVVRLLSRELGWHVDVGEAPGGGARFRLRIAARPAGGDT